jgi:hypothetical protein
MGEGGGRGWMQNEGHKMKVDTGDELLAHFCHAAARIKKSENQHKDHAIFARGVQSALRLMVGFSNIYCEL